MAFGGGCSHHSTHEHNNIELLGKRMGAVEMIVRWEGILITIGLTVIVGLWLLWVSKKYPNAFD